MQSRNHAVLSRDTCCSNNYYMEHALRFFACAFQQRPLQEILKEVDIVKQRIRALAAVKVSVEHKHSSISDASITWNAG